MHDLTAQEAISGILGSVSLASWVFLLVLSLLKPLRTCTSAEVMCARYPN